MSYRYYEQNTSGMNFDRFLDRFDESTVVRLKRHYWTAKQMLRSKMGKKEDEFLTASDATLDSKLTLFESLRDTSENLLAAIENYQGYLLDAAHTENSLGKYLKERGKKEKREETGMVMVALGRALMFSSHQRAAIRQPLVRFYQELHVFAERAIFDCAQTVDAVEKARTEYRGSLLWMKKTSEELDPDGERQMEKFREVQGAVRLNKERLDKLKLDTLQKVDLLSASRSNLLAHLLGKYLDMLATYYRKTAQTYTALSANLSVFNHYDFEILTDLIEPSRKLAQKIRQESMDKEEAEKKERRESAKEEETQNLLSFDDEPDGSIRRYLFGRESPVEENSVVEEERADSPLAEYPEEAEEAAVFEEERRTPEGKPSVPIGPLAPRFDVASVSAPKLNPPPPGSGPGANGKTQKGSDLLNLLSFGEPTKSAQAPSSSHLLDLMNLSSTTQFPNPFTETQNNEWDSLLSQCDLQNSNDLI